MARRYGWSDEVINGLPEIEAAPARAAALGLDQPTHLALRFAERMTRDSNAVEDELFQALRRNFDEGQMVELAAVIGLFNYFNRFNNAFEMEPTQPGDR